MDLQQAAILGGRMLVAVGVAAPIDATALQTDAASSHCDKILTRWICGRTESTTADMSMHDERKDAQHSTAPCVMRPLTGLFSP